MPYDSIEKLPPAVRKNLPVEAQHIFMATFNKAYFEYAKEGGMRQEISAFRVAWASVKKSYKKSGGKWVKRE